MFIALTLRSLQSRLGLLDCTWSALFLQLAQIGNLVQDTRFLYAIGMVEDLGVRQVLGYVRVSTAEQSESGLGLEAQRAAITAESSRRGWQLLEVFTDAGVSAKSLRGRGGLTDALGRLAGRQATALIVSKHDRLSRSLLDFASLMERARREGWALVALDLGVDTTTPSGEMMAS